MSEHAPDIERDATDDSLFDDVGNRAGAALRRPAPADGPHTIAARRRSQQLVRTAVAAGAVTLAMVVLVAVTRGDDSSPLPPADSVPPTSTVAPRSVPIAFKPGFDVSIEAGTYLLPASGSTARDMTITLPAGWKVQDGHVFGKLGETGSSSDDLAIDAVLVDDVFDDPCRGDAGDTVAVGNSDLGGLLVEHARDFVTGPEDATLSGLPAQRYDFAIPKGYAIGRCTYPGVQIWHSTTADDYFVVLRDATASAYLVDVGGQQQVVLTQIGKSASADDVRELDTILQSIRIAP